MSAEFDPYRRWLGIPPHEQPPHHYRLLGIGVFEDDPDFIEEAADRQMSHVQTHRTGQHSALSQKLLNELSAAKLCLLNSEEKNAYDAQLRAQLLTPRSPSPRDEAAEVSALAIDVPQSESRPVVLVSTPAAARVIEKRRNSLLGTQPALLASAAVALAVLVGIGVWLWTREKAPRIAKVAEAPTGPQPQAKPPAPKAPLLVNATKSPPAVRPVIGVVPTTPQSEPTQAIDLLKLIDVNRDSVGGQWRFEGPMLVAPVFEWARLQIPFEPPENYSLAILLEAPDQYDALVLSLPGGGFERELDLGMGAENFLGGRENPDGAQYQGRPFWSDQPNELLVSVRTNGVRVECNGEQLIDWKGDPKMLLPPDKWGLPNKSQLGIGCWNTQYRIRKLELRPLTCAPPAPVIREK